MLAAKPETSVAGVHNPARVPRQRVLWHVISPAFNPRAFALEACQAVCPEARGCGSVWRLQPLECDAQAHLLTTLARRAPGAGRRARAVNTPTSGSILDQRLGIVTIGSA